MPTTQTVASTAAQGSESRATGIAALTNWYAPAGYGLHWPRGKRHLLPALLWGLAPAPVVNAGNSWLDVPPHIQQTTGDIVYTHQNPWGPAVFESIHVGPTVEIRFRVLLVPYRAAAMPGKLRIGPFCMNCGGMIAALLLASTHVPSFWTKSRLDALFQQGYEFVLGVLYACWLEKPPSIVAYNITDGLTFAFWALDILQS